MVSRPFRNCTEGRGKPLVWQVMVTVLALSRHVTTGLSITDKLNEETGSLVATGGKIIQPKLKQTYQIVPSSVMYTSGRIPLPARLLKMAE